MARKRLRSVTYREELGDVAAGSHDSGPHALPTVDEIDAVLADLDEETAPVEPDAESEATS